MWPEDLRDHCHGLQWGWLDSGMPRTVYIEQFYQKSTLLALFATSSSFKILHAQICTEFVLHLELCNGLYSSKSLCCQHFVVFDVRLGPTAFLSNPVAI